jgi:hypothetical protein
VTTNSETSDSSPAPNPEAERAELLRLDEEGRQAHFATDAAALLAHDAEPVLYVRDGAILSMTRAELLRIYADDMQGATYHEWDLLEPPIVRIAGDASIAWVITRRRIRRTKRQADGTVEDQVFTYAGVNAYEKRMGAWVRVANASTFAEGDAKS